MAVFRLWGLKILFSIETVRVYLTYYKLLTFIKLAIAYLKRNTHFWPHNSRWHFKQIAEWTKFQLSLKIQVVEPQSQDIWKGFLLLTEAMNVRYPGGTACRTIVCDNCMNCLIVSMWCCKIFTCSQDRLLCIYRDFTFFLKLHLQNSLEHLSGWVTCNNFSSLK